MRARTFVLVLLTAFLSIALASPAAACAECASSDGVVGCRYRFFYGSQCTAYWDPSTGGFRCEQSGVCDEVGPPDPEDPDDRRGPFNQTLPPGIWAHSPGPVEVPDAVFAVLPEFSRPAIHSLDATPGA